MKLSYVIKRILLTVFIFIIVMTLNFFIPRLGVEDPAERYYPPQGNMSDIEYEIIKDMTREQYGLNGTTWAPHGSWPLGWQPYILSGFLRPRRAARKRAAYGSPLFPAAAA